MVQGHWVKAAREERESGRNLSGQNAAKRDEDDFSRGFYSVILLIVCVTEFFSFGKNIQNTKPALRTTFIEFKVHGGNVKSFFF